jgi:hypothetical protein
VKERLVDRNVRVRHQRNASTERSSSATAAPITRVLPVPGGPQTADTPGASRAPAACRCSSFRPSSVSGSAVTRLPIPLSTLANPADVQPSR